MIPKTSSYAWRLVLFLTHSLLHAARCMKIGRFTLRNDRKRLRSLARPLEKRKLVRHHLGNSARYSSMSIKSVHFVHYIDQSKISFFCYVSYLYEVFILQMTSNQFRNVTNNINKVFESEIIFWKIWYKQNVKSITCNILNIDLTEIVSVYVPFTITRWLR